MEGDEQARARTMAGWYHQIGVGQRTLNIERNICNSMGEQNILFSTYIS